MVSTGEPGRGRAAFSHSQIGTNAQTFSGKPRPLRLVPSPPPLMGPPEWADYFHDSRVRTHRRSGGTRQPALRATTGTRACWEDKGFENQRMDDRLHVPYESDDQAAGSAPLSGSSRGHQDERQGLALAHSPVREHGGRIWFNSEAGIGTTFSSAFPWCPSLPSGPAMDWSWELHEYPQA